MKKTLMAMLALLGLGMTAQAQTQFRHITFDEAKTAAKAENKLIFVDFYTTWCGPCKMLASKVFPTKKIGDYLNPRFVCLKMDAEAEGKDLAKSIKVAAYPTLAVFDADGKLLGSFAGARTGQQFITAVETARDPEMTPQRVKERYEGGERTPQLVSAYAAQMSESKRDNTAGTAVMDEYFATLDDAQRLAPENAQIYISYIFDTANPRFAYLLANKTRLDQSKAASYDMLINQVFASQAKAYMSDASLRTSAEAKAAYKAFKKLAKANGMDKKLAVPMSVADARESKDDAAYLAYCDQVFGTMTEDEQAAFMHKLPTAVATDTPEQAGQAIDFVRRHIAAMSAPGMVTAAYAAYNVFNKRN